MKIVRLEGGLGNQMFQYAFYLALRNAFPDERFYFEIDSLERDLEHEGFELGAPFGIEVEKRRCSPGERNRYRAAERPRRGIRKWLHFNRRVYVNHRELTYDPRVFSMEGPVFYEGLWQSEKYFEGVADEVRDAFRFRPFSRHEDTVLAGEMSDSESVAIHVRRGDYLGSERHRVCGQDYYKKAMSILQETLRDPHYFFFSDDISWCRSHFQGANTTFVERPDVREAFRDMQLMSSCRHKVIANSTFSWWAAWLSGRNEGRVIAPERWLNDSPSTRRYEIDDILPGHWRRLSPGAQAC